MSNIKVSKQDLEFMAKVYQLPLDEEVSEATRFLLEEWLNGSEMLATRMAEPKNHNVYPYYVIKRSE
jgi:hypothetical protein